jgi:nucleoid-associated protein YgaU
MRNARTLLFLLFLAIVAIAAALMFFVGDAPQQQAAREDAETQAGGQEPAPSQETAVNPGLTRPTFDVVRVEKDGSVVMAGQAEPGATVMVHSGNAEIGRAIADENGEWILQQDEKLSNSEHAIELSAQSPGGERTLFSKQRLALSLSDPRQGEPLVALTEEGKPTRILQMPTPEMLNDLAEANADQSATVASVDDFPSAAVVTGETEPAIGATAPAVTDAAPVSGPEQVVGFASIDYEDADQKSMIYVTGVGTPGARVAVYVNNNFVGFAIADASGNWSFANNRQLEGGTHFLRADVLDKAGSTVLARAEVNFQREPASDTRTALFDQGSKEVEAIAGPGPDDQTAPDAAEAEPRIIIVKHGDTLWHIAQEYFGDGARYTQIFQNNRGQIRNPHRIYPDQRFVLPGDKPQFN